MAKNAITCSVERRCFFTNLLLKDKRNNAQQKRPDIIRTSNKPFVIICGLYKMEKSGKNTAPRKRNLRTNCNLSNVFKFS